MSAKEITQAAWFIGSHEIDKLTDLCRAAFRVSPTTGWRVLGEQWDRFEITYPLRELLETALTYCPRWIARRAFMDQQERLAYRSLPDVITIHRGGRGLHVVSGLSWSTSKKTARFFAEYAGGLRRAAFGMKVEGRPTILTTKVRKTDILGVKVSRDEHEIVVIPGAVSVSSIKVEGAR